MKLKPEILVVELHSKILMAKESWRTIIGKLSREIIIEPISELRGSKSPRKQMCKLYIPNQACTTSYLNRGIITKVFVPKFRPNETSTSMTID